MPRLPSCLRDRTPLPSLPVAARALAPGTLHPFHRPHGLRRLLCQRGKARQSRAAQQARDRRRRQARGRVHLLLHGADQGRAIGDADVQGAETLPRGGGRQAARRALRCRLEADPRLHGRADTEDRTAFAGRGIPRPLGHRTAPPGAACGPALPPPETDGDRTGPSPVRSVSRTTSSSPRSHPTSTSRAAFR